MKSCGMKATLVCGCDPAHSCRFCSLSRVSRERGGERGTQADDWTVLGGERGTQADDWTVLGGGKRGTQADDWIVFSSQAGRPRAVPVLPGRGQGPVRGRLRRGLQEGPERNPAAGHRPPGARHQVRGRGPAGAARHGGECHAASAYCRGKRGILRCGVQHPSR